VKTMNCWWLFFKHNLNHLFDDWVCLYIDGLWIIGVDYEVWLELWSLEVLVKNEYDDGNLMIWCYERMVWFILMFLLCMLTVSEVCTMILDQLKSKLSFWSEFLIGNPFLSSLTLGNLAGRAGVFHGEECRTTHVVPCTPGLSGRFRILPSVPFDVFWCCFN